MAIARLSSIVGAISGSIGSTTFKNTKAGTVLAARVPPARHPTSRQFGPRTAYALCIRAWRDKSLADRLVWFRLAQTFPHTTRLGTSHALSGFQLFMKFTLPWAFVYRTVLDAVPSPTTNTPPRLDYTDYTNDDAFEITYQVDPQSNPARPLIFMGRTFSTSQPKHWHRYTFLLDGENDPGDNTQDLSTPVDEILGRPEVGEVVFTRLVSISSTAFPSFPYDFARQVT